MNRLVIVGNGFDLAHDLPTSYCHFIDDFWKNFKNNYKKEEYAEIIFVNEQYYGFLNYSTINNFDDLKKSLIDYSEEYNHRYSDKNCTCYTNDGKAIFYFKNQFLYQINFIKSIENWVDIENEYFNELKKIVEYKSLDITKTKDDNINARKEKIIVLNKEFRQIKNLLESYLVANVENVFDTGYGRGDRDWVKIYEMFKPISAYNNESKVVDEFFDFEDKALVNDIISRPRLEGEFEPYIYFLNFNYTNTLFKYVNPLLDAKLNVKCNFIHGRLSSELNPINFGFGDEMDEDYKLIENINDNEYLQNFKSFNYFQNGNYKSLMDYINSDKFQVYIIGHSCGLSDRTLLNTVFEHNNCRSIKIYYYDKGDSDNYTDIVQNISRHFNDKVVMRNKIVNKSLCKPFPQDVSLPLKVGI